MIHGILFCVVFFGVGMLVGFLLGESDPDIDNRRYLDGP